jgi:hypothetical protein
MAQNNNDTLEIFYNYIINIHDIFNKFKTSLPNLYTWYFVYTFLLSFQNIFYIYLQIKSIRFNGMSKGKSKENFRT